MREIGQIAIALAGKIVFILDENREKREYWLFCNHFHTNLKLFSSS